MTSKTGVCIFAYNNDILDYHAMADICARNIKKYLELPVCVITDKNFESEFVDTQIIHNYACEYNPRWGTNFKNRNKWEVWNLTPFENTILMDADYYVMNDNLQYSFGLPKHVNCLQTVKQIAPKYNKYNLKHHYIDYDNTYKTLWSTIIAFNKSDESTLFFKLWNYVQDNYEYFHGLLGLRGKTFRTDYVLTIINILTHGELIGALPIKPYEMAPEDHVRKLSNDSMSIVTIPNDADNFIQTKITNSDVHVQSKELVS
jgi:hypothetical protein